MGSAYTLVADHVVQGRVVFPAAAYLETARAVCSAAIPSCDGAVLDGVLFLQPLTLERSSVDGGGVSIECIVREGGAFEIFQKACPEASLMSTIFRTISGALQVGKMRSSVSVAEVQQLIRLCRRLEAEQPMHLY